MFSTRSTSALRLPHEPAHRTIPRADAGGVADHHAGVLPAAGELDGVRAGLAGGELGGEPYVPTVRCPAPLKAGCGARGRQDDAGAAGRRRARASVRVGGLRRAELRGGIARRPLGPARTGGRGTAAQSRVLSPGDPASRVVSPRAGVRDNADSVGRHALALLVDRTSSVWSETVWRTGSRLASPDSCVIGRPSTNLEQAVRARISYKTLL